MWIWVFPVRTGVSVPLGAHWLSGTANFPGSIDLTNIRAICIPRMCASACPDPASRRQRALDGVLTYEELRARRALPAGSAPSARGTMPGDGRKATRAVAGELGSAATRLPSSARGGGRQDVLCLGGPATCGQIPGMAEPMHPFLWDCASERVGPAIAEPPRYRGTGSQALRHPSQLVGPSTTRTRPLALSSTIISSGSAA